jgi:hypothetical protein
MLAPHNNNRNANPPLSLSTIKFLNHLFNTAASQRYAVPGDFSNDYLSLVSHPRVQLCPRCARACIIRSATALFFNSGIEAGLFLCVLQSSNALLHDGHSCLGACTVPSRTMTCVRCMLRSQLRTLRDECSMVREGKSGMFVDAESVQRMVPSLLSARFLVT